MTKNERDFDACKELTEAFKACVNYPQVEAIIAEEVVLNGANESDIWEAIRYTDGHVKGLIPANVSSNQFRDGIKQEANDWEKQVELAKRGPLARAYLKLQVQTKRFIGTALMALDELELSNPAEVREVYTLWVEVAQPKNEHAFKRTAEEVVNALRTHNSQHTDLVIQLQENVFGKEEKDSE